MVNYHSSTDHCHCFFLDPSAIFLPFPLFSSPGQHGPQVPCLISHGAEAGCATLQTAGTLFFPLFYLLLGLHPCHGHRSRDNCDTQLLPCPLICVAPMKITLEKSTVPFHSAYAQFTQLRSAWQCVGLFDKSILVHTDRRRQAQWHGPQQYNRDTRASS